MPRRHIIARLPAELREIVSSMWREGWERSAIHAALVERGVAIRLSTVEAWCRRLSAATATAQRQRAATNDFLDRVLATGRGAEMGSINVELLQGAIMEALAGEAGEPVELSARDLRQLGQAVAELARAAKMNAEMVAREAERAAGRVVAIGRAEGLSEPALARIRRECYGLTD